MTRRRNRRLAALLTACLLLLGTLSSAWATEALNYTISDLEAWSEARVRELYGALMAAATLGEVYPIMDGTSDAAFASLLASLPAEKSAALTAHLEALAPAQETWRASVNYTDAAPLSGLSGEGAPDGASLSQDVAANADGTYTITLEAFLTGDTEIPADIILVLDQSANMDGLFGDDEEAVYGAGYAYRADGGAVCDAYGFEQAGDVFWIRIADCVYQSVTKSTNRDAHGFDFYYYETDGARSYVYPELEADPGGASRANPYPVARFYTRSGTRKLDALKAAAAGFAADVAQKAKGADGAFGTADDVGHRIAVIGFADAGNTQLLTGASLQDMRTSAGRGGVDAAIGALDARGFSCPQYAMEMANGLFDANPVPAGQRRACLIVFLSGGMPGDGASFSDAEANAAIARARTAKSGGATVYAVGIFAGADGSSPGALSGGDDEEKCNAFMQLLSSNYPDATSLTGTGALNTHLGGGSCCLSARSASALARAFGRIADRTCVESGAADGATEIREILALPFVLAEGASVALYEADCAGTDGEGNDRWGARAPSDAAYAVETDAEGRTVLSATGFDFAKNRVSGDGSGGRKFIVELCVRARDGFLGGNSVPVCDAASGLYDGETLRAAFAVPVVNVPIPAHVTGTEADRNVYLLGDLSADDLLAGAAGGMFSPDQSEYVDVGFRVSADEEGLIDADFTDLTADCAYWLTATISPKTAPAAGVPGAAAVETLVRRTAQINVFTPELSFRDGEVWYGAEVLENPDCFDMENRAGTVWKHGEATAADAAMTGPEPELKLEYTLASGVSDGVVDAKDDIPVSVAVWLNNGAAETPDWVCVTDAASFARAEITKMRGLTAAASDDAAFLLHVCTCTLTIANTGGAADESYVFNISQNGTAYMTVSVWGNGSVTIGELPTGTYTVAPEAAWSWRWTGSAAQAVLDELNSEARITCVNEANGKLKWLNGYGAATAQSGE